MIIFTILYNLLYQIPLWAMFAVTVGIVLLSLWLGLRLGQIRRKSESGVDSPIGSVAGAVLGLLAFILALTFSISMGRFETRRQLLLDEVNAIQTTYLRGGLLKEPRSTEVRQLLRDYVDLRANLHKNMGRLADAIKQSENIQNKLWNHAIGLAKEDRTSEVYALFTESLNQMIDLHTNRVVIGTKYRIAPVIWGVLFFVTSMSMLVVGYQFGLAGRGSFIMCLFLALTFSSVLYLVMDLDRHTDGMITVSQQPMIDLQKKMQSP